MNVVEYFKRIFGYHYLPEREMREEVEAIREYGGVWGPPVALALDEVLDRGFKGDRQAWDSKILEAGATIIPNQQGTPTHTVDDNGLVQEIKRDKQ